MPDGYRLTDDDRLTSAERRKRDAAQTPLVLYGTPSAEELAAARGRAGSRGVLVVPEALREHIRELPCVIDGAADQARDEYRAAHADEPYDDPHLGNEYDHYTERARVICAGGDHESAVALDRQAEHEKVAAHEAAEQDRIWREGGIVDITRHSEETMFKVQAAITALGYSGQPVLDIIGSLQNAGILFRERAPEYEMQPESSDTIKSENVEATMAEEPIESRLRRAWLNGFRDGVDRASYAATESTGRWDY